MGSCCGSQSTRCKNRRTYCRRNVSGLGCATPNQPIRVRVANASLAATANRTYCDLRCDGAGSGGWIDSQAALGAATDSADTIGGMACKLVVCDRQPHFKPRYRSNRMVEIAAAAATSVVGLESSGQQKTHPVAMLRVGSFR